MRLFYISLLSAALTLGGTANAAHTTATLLLSSESAPPGDTVLAGVHLKMDEGWHTYWKNPGASGMPTEIAWELPAGVTAGAVEWPVPEKLPDVDLTTYIYKREVVLLVPLKIAANVAPGALTLKAKVSWLECDVQCLPGDAEVQATLAVGSESKPSKAATLLENWRNKVPQPRAGMAVSARWESPAAGDTRPLLLEWQASNSVSQADFYPDSSEAFEIQGPTDRVPTPAGKVLIRKQVKKLSGDWPSHVSGVFVQLSGTTQTAWTATLPVGTPVAARTSPLTQPLGLMLLYAFLGGLILNVMPCVLPVIALKILGFVGESREDRGRVRKLGVLYGVGVLVSFLVLATLVVALKAANHKVGWGMQFGNAQFLVILTVLVTLVALNLFGLFEVNLGGRVMGAAGTLASKQGSAGAFFNGVLATVLATPCTAPILAPALGFAFLPSQSAVVTFAIFLTVGMGLAFPYVLLSWEPAWLRFVPKPGPWMQRFKVAMGFPMLATAVWLFSLLPTHYGPRTWWLAMFLVVLGLAAWVYGEFGQRAGRRRGLAAAVALGVLALGYVFVVEGELRWRSPQPPLARGTAPESEGGIPWQPWTPAAVAQARAEGRPVLVDFTADWCLTCQANKRLAIDVPSVREKLKSINAVTLLGDYTRLPDNITEELNRYGRAGVPLVLVFPKDVAKPAIVLPEALTPGIVLAALDRAVQ